MSNPIGSYQPGTGGASTGLKVPKLTFDVSKYGADPAVTGSINTAINNIFAAPTWPANSQGATIYIPDMYPLSEPLFLPDTNFTLEGGNPGCGFSGGSAHQAIVGIKREMGTMPLTAGHWPAMVGMDAGWSGGRYGFAFYDPATGLTNPDMRFLSFFGASFGLAGNHWTTLNKFTLEFCVNSQIAGAGAGAASLGPGIPPPGFGFGFTPLDNNASRPWKMEFEGTLYTTTAVTGGASPTMTLNYGLGGNNWYGAGGGQPNNAFLVITGGTGIGQIKQITSHTGNNATGTVTFGTAWTTLPDTTSTGYITADIYFPITLATTRLADGTQPGYDPYTAGSGYNTGLTFPANLPAPANGVWRFKIQIDLTASTAANFLQGWVSTTGSAAANFVAMPVYAPLALPLANPNFVEQWGNLFQIGSIFNSALNEGSNPFRPGPIPLAGWSITLQGFSIVAGVAGGNVYSVGATPAINPTGSGLAGTIGDSYSFYLRNNNNTVAYLPMTDNGGGFNAGRLFTSSDGAAYLSSGFVFPYFGSGSAIGGGITVKNLTFNNGRYGAAICLGGDLSCTVDNVNVTGGSHAIGVLPVFANYTHTFSNINAIYCNDAAISLWRSICVLRNFGTSSCWASLRLMTSSIDFDNVNFGNIPYTPYQVRIHAGGYGTSFIGRSLNSDNESLGANGPSQAIIYIDSEQQGSDSRIVIDNLSTGTVGYYSPYIKLMTGGNTYSTIILRSPGINGAGLGPLVQVCGSNKIWKGEISNAQMGAYGFADDFDFDLYPIIDATYGAKTTRIAFHPSLPSLPFTGIWTAGGTEITVLAEGMTPGMPRKFAVVTTGQFGTSTPPVFDGFDIYSPDGTHNATVAIAPREDYATATTSRV